MGSEEKRSLVYIALASINISLVIPLFVLSNNTFDLKHIELLNLIIFLVLFGLAVAAVLLAIRRLFVAASMGRAFQIGIQALFFFTVLTGLVLPLTGEAGQVEMRSIPLNTENLLLAAVGAMVLLVISFTRWHGALLFGVVAFLAVNAVTSVSKASVALSSQKRENMSIYTASSTKNVFILSFDGLPGPVATEVLNENPELQRQLKDFTFFPNAITSSPATFASITSETSGDVDLKEEFGEQTAIMERMDHGRLITNTLEKNGFVVSTYGTYGRMFSEQARDFAIGTLGEARLARYGVRNSAEVLDYALARTFSPLTVFVTAVTEDVIRRIDKTDKSSFTHRLINHAGDDWDKINLLGFTDFYAYLESLHVGETAPVAHFTHFLHTHFPIDLDAECNYRSDDKEWFQARQNRQGAKDETECVLRQAALFVNKLRELDIYDKSMIVLKSDHGQPVSYNDPTRLESFTIRGHKYWGFARYKPLLSVKPFGENRETLSIDERPAILGDLATTICTAVEIAENCERFPGYDLLRPGNTIPEDATYFVNIVAKSDATFKIDGHESIRMRRTRNFFEDLNDRLTAEILTSAPTCGASVELADAKAYNNGQSDYATWVTWSDASSSFVKVRTPQCGGHVSLRVSIAVGQKAELIANGVPIETIDGHAEAFDVTADLSTVPDSEFLTLALRPASETASAPTIHRIGF